MNKKIKVLALSTTLLTGVTAFSPTILAQTLVQAVEQTIQSNPEVLAEAYRRLSVDKTIWSGIYQESCDTPRQRDADERRGQHYRKTNVI